MRRLIIICCICSLLLTGCGEVHNIYAICAIKSDVRYCYDDKGNMYFEDENMDMQPIVDCTLEAIPKLNFYPEAGSYSIKFVLPNQYSCTLKDLSHYVFACNKTLNAKSHVDYIDCKDIIIDIRYNDISAKLYYNVSGSLRGYCVNDSGIPVHLPLLRS